MKKKNKSKFSWDDFLSKGHNSPRDFLNKDDKHKQSVFQRIAYLSQHHPSAIDQLRTAVPQWSADEQSRILNAVDSQGMTPLGQAISRGNSSAVDLLSSLGGELRGATGNQSWLLTLLDRMDDDVCIRSLLQKTNLSHKISDELALVNSNLSRKSALSECCIALIKNNKLALLQLLIELGAQPNNPSDLLNHAICNKADNLSTFLIGHFDATTLSQVDSQNQSPLMLASELAQVDTVARLLEKGVNIEILDNKGQNVIHRLVCIPEINWQKEHTTIAQRIIDTHEIIVNQPDAAGNNAAMLAAITGHDALCCSLLPYVNLYMLNQANQHILYLATSHLCIIALQDIVDQSTKDIHQPFSLLETACDVEPRLQKSFQKAYDRLYRISDANDDKQLFQRATPLSRIMLSSSSCQQLTADNTSMSMDEMIDQERVATKIANILFTFADYQTTETDVFACGLVAGNFNRAYKYLISGFPITARAHKLLDHLQSNLPNVDGKIIGTMKTIAQIDKMIQSNGLEKTLPLISTVPCHRFRLTWAIEHWDVLGDHFLLLSLETLLEFNPMTSAIIYKSLQRTNVCPYLLLDQYHLGSVENFPVHAMQRFLKYLLKQIIVHRSTDRQKQHLQDRHGFDCTQVQPTWPDSSEFQKEITEMIPDRIMGEHRDNLLNLSPLAQEWLAILNTAHADLQPTGQTMPTNIRHAFVCAFDRYVSYENFEKHQHDPATMLQIMVILHRCEQQESRRQFFNQLNRMITSLSTKAVKDSAQLSPERLQHYADKVIDGPLSQDDLLALADICLQAYQSQVEDAVSGQFFDFIVDTILNSTGIIFKYAHLNEWLKRHFDYYVSPERMIRISGHIIEEIQDCDQPEISLLISTMLKNISVAFLDQIRHVPLFMMFFTQAERMEQIEKQSPCYQYLQSYVAYYSYIEQSKQSEREEKLRAQQNRHADQSKLNEDENQSLINDNHRLRQKNHQLNLEIKKQQERIQTLSESMQAQNESHTVSSKPLSAADFWADRRKFADLKEAYAESQSQQHELRQRLQQLEEENANQKIASRDEIKQQIAARHKQCEQISQLKEENLRLQNATQTLWAKDATTSDISGEHGELPVDVEHSERLDGEKDHRVITESNETDGCLSSP